MLKETDLLNAGFERYELDGLYERKYRRYGEIDTYITFTEKSDGTLYDIIEIRIIVSCGFLFNAKMMVTNDDNVLTTLKEAFNKLSTNLDIDKLLKVSCPKDGGDSNE